MRRKDSFFGLHFDYHANKDTKDIGKNFDEKVVERIVKEVKPDFIQCDTKGHPGYSSYKTEAGTPAPHLVNDILAGWRKVTAKYGVALYSHYSGVWDKKAAEDHPDWCAVNKDGTLTDKMSVFGDYADKLLIPQMKELALKYKTDGAWVDGECWGAAVDYSEKAKKAFYEKTGKRAEDLSDEEYKEYLAFNRQGFFDYVKHYIEEIKKVAPEFDITSNWFNTVFVPDDLRFTDYVSGDLAPSNSVDSARFDGRIMQSFGRNWDIMSWGINFPVHHVKSPVQLMQEAAVIMALGGGFQVYNMQSPQNVVMDEWAIPYWAEISAFCRARKEFAHNGKIVPNIGVVYSAAAYYNDIDCLFTNASGYSKEFSGMLLALCDLGESVSVLNEQRLEEYGLENYKTLVVTNASALGEGIKERLLSYAKAGGNLVICGADSVKLFADDVGARVIKEYRDHPVMRIEDDDYKVEVRRDYLNAELEGGKVLCYMYEGLVDGDMACTNPPPSINFDGVKAGAFIKREFGKGTVAIMPVNLGNFYNEEKTFEAARFFKKCFGSYGKGVATIDRGGEAEVLATEKNGKKYIHVVNLTGEHRNPKTMSFETIPALYGVNAELAADKKPRSVKLQPEGKEIPFVYENGRVKIALDKVEIYTIIEVK